MNILYESLNKYFDNLEEECLTESTTKMHPMQIYVMLLEFFSGKDFGYLLKKSQKQSKNNNTYTEADYCFHHVDGDHTNNSLNNVVVIKTSDHNLLTHNKKKLSDCDYVDLGKYIDDYGNKLLQCAENEENNI